MKFSMYNIWTSRRDGTLILFNSLTGALAVFEKRYSKTVRRSLESKNVSQIPEEFLPALVDDGYLVSQEKNEFSVIEKLVRKRQGWMDEFFLSVVLSLDCNFRCYYCFEKHTGEHMNEAVAQRVLAMIRRNSNRMTKLSVDWYGGEPLLSFKRLRSMNDAITNFSRINGIDYSFSITTNGYLLSKEIVKYIKERPLSYLQITVDGPPQTHNKSRILKNGGPTFDVILRNIKHAVSKNIDIMVRVNITKHNVDYIPELYEIMEKEGLKNKLYLRLKPVVSSPANPCSQCCLVEKELGKKMAEIYRQAAENGWVIFPYVDNLQCMGFCIAEYPRHFIVDINGGLYKCGEIFNSSERVGHIGENGKIVITNQTEYDLWVDKNPLTFSECSRCSILPICMGGCNMKRFRYGADCCEELKHDLDGFLEILVLNQINLENIKNSGGYCLNHNLKRR